MTTCPETETDPAVYSRETLPLLSPWLLEQALHTISFGITAKTLPPEKLNGTAEAAAEAHANARKAAGIVAKANLRLAILHIQSYRSDATREQWEDLVQKGYEALYDAALRYDLRVGVKYSTYAMFWIRQRTHKEFSRSKEMMRGYKHRLRSLDEPFARSAGDGHFTLLDTLCDETSSEALESALSRSDVSNFLQLLPHREREALALYYGVEEHSGNETRRSFNEIGELMGVSGETARKITLMATARIRDYANSDGESMFCDEGGLGWEMPEMPEVTIQLPLFD